MLSWVKSFTGRIMDIQSSSESSVFKIISDWKSMYGCTDRRPKTANEVQQK